MESPRFLESPRKGKCTLQIEYYPPIEKSGIVRFTVKWVELEDTVSHEISQTQKYKCQVSSATCGKK